MSLVWALWGGECDLLPAPEWVAAWHGLEWKVNPYLLAKQNSEPSFENSLKPAVNSRTFAGLCLGCICLSAVSELGTVQGSKRPGPA